MSAHFGGGGMKGLEEFVRELLRKELFNITLPVLSGGVTIMTKVAKWPWFALNRHDWRGFLSVWLLKQQPCSAPTQVPGGLVQGFTIRSSRGPAPCLPTLMLAHSTAALQRGCDFFIISPREAACPHISNLLLIQESSVVVALDETAMGENRQENTNVELSEHICPTALLRSALPSENHFYFLTAYFIVQESSCYSDAFHTQVFD